MVDSLDNIRLLSKNLKTSILRIFRFFSKAKFFFEILILSKKYCFLGVTQTKTLARNFFFKNRTIFDNVMCVIAKLNFFLGHPVLFFTYLSFSSIDFFLTSQNDTRRGLVYFLFS